MSITSATPVPGQNIRHDIDPAVVAEAVARRLADLDRHSQYQLERAREFSAKYLQDVADGTVSKNWTWEPRDPEDVERQHLESRQTEETYYAKVRVIELPLNGRRFILVYGDTIDATVTSGTGPFESFDKAVAWFVGLGR